MEWPAALVIRGLPKTKRIAYFIKGLFQQSFPVLGHHRFGVATDLESLHHGANCRGTGIFQWNLQEAEKRDETGTATLDLAVEHRE